jgi:hypothetical protein
MSWRITLVKNDVKISKVTAKAVWEATAHRGESDVFFNLEEVSREGKLTFNSDHMEHMDYLSNTKVQTALKAAKVTGEICFADTDSGADPSFWGYRFDGKGGMKRLSGSIVWAVSSD